MTSWTSKFRFAWERHQAQVTFLPLVAAGLIVLGVTVGIDKTWSWMEPTLALAGAALGIVVWWNQMVGGWRDALPKRLTARFVHENEPTVAVMICHHAPLSDEGDIRPLCQQLGAQMAGSRELAFRPIFTMKHPKGVEVTDAVAKTTYLDYEMTFFLTKLPAHLESLKSGGRPAPYVEWRPPKFCDARDAACAVAPAIVAAAASSKPADAPKAAPTGGAPGA